MDCSSHKEDNKMKKIVNVTLTESQALFLCASYNIAAAVLQSDPNNIKQAVDDVIYFLKYKTISREEIIELHTIVKNIAISFEGWETMIVHVDLPRNYKKPRVKVFKDYQSKKLEEFIIELENKQTEFKIYLRNRQGRYNEYAIHYWLVNWLFNKEWDCIFRVAVVIAVVIAIASSRRML
jgi:hypothetical protein